MSVHELANGVLLGRLPRQLTGFEGWHGEHTTEDALIVS